MLLDGLHIPLTTPFYPDGRLYLRKLEHNVERYSRTPAAGLAILTQTGERSLISDEETREVLKTAIEASAPEKVMLANVSRSSVNNTLELAGSAAGLDYDALLLSPPTLLTNQTQSIGVLALYFHAVADRSPLPIVIEDNGAMPLELIAELSANPAFLGISLDGRGVDRFKQVQAAASAATRELTVTHLFAVVTRRMKAARETVGAGNYIAADSLTSGATALASAPPAPAIKTRTKKAGFQILSRSTASGLDHLQAGAGGLMLAFAACAPQAVYEVLAAWKDGDPKLAGEKQQRLLAAAAEIEEGMGVAAIKAACDLNGYYGGRPRLPLLPLSGDERRKVEDLMANMRN